MSAREDGGSKTTISHRIFFFFFVLPLEHISVFVSQLE